MTPENIAKASNSGFRIYRISPSDKSVRYWNGFEWRPYQRFSTNADMLAAYKRYTSTPKSIGEFRSQDVLKLKSHGFRIIRLDKNQRTIKLLNSEHAWSVLSRHETVEELQLKWAELTQQSDTITH